jgi:Tol biopolymer transport system component
MRHRLILLLAAALATTGGGTAEAIAPSTTLVSVSDSEAQANAAGFYYEQAVVSGGGRLVAFASDATNLVLGDTNGTTDVFVRDTVAGTTERVSVSSLGVEGDGASGQDTLAMSPDGRFVVFSSDATNLVAGDDNFFVDKFIRDRTTGVTRRLRHVVGYASLAISADGRYVAFDEGGAHVPIASRLDRSTGKVASTVIGFDQTPQVIGLSADGDRMLVEGSGGIYIHDFASDRTRRIALSNLVPDRSLSGFANALSANGRYVMFTSDERNLVAFDNNRRTDVFVRDLALHRTLRVSIANNEDQSRGGSRGLGISGLGRYRLFVSFGSNLVAGDTNGVADIFIRDSVAGSTTRCSVADDGTQADRGSAGGILSQSGRFAAFVSNATNLVAGDTNAMSDLFERGPGC